MKKLFVVLMVMVLTIGLVFAGVSNKITSRSVTGATVQQVDTNTIQYRLGSIDYNVMKLQFTYTHGADTTWKIWVQPNGYNLDYNLEDTVVTARPYTYTRCLTADSLTSKTFVIPVDVKGVSTLRVAILKVGARAAADSSRTFFTVFPILK